MRDLKGNIYFFKKQLICANWEKNKLRPEHKQKETATFSPTRTPASQKEGQWKSSTEGTNRTEILYTCISPPSLHLHSKEEGKPKRKTTHQQHQKYEYIKNQKRKTVPS
ncbi:hypothetical protein, unlikely [Trypanosoma brucei gambiense DAL972]|uniref:Uncharacterized protein n=1 Tax=Trypanosoma brucei gambiense (strain MHOM/CI/86/DAL972) TaxID=679716 RepID=D0A0A2_TRYB9|nr:hypothetical protein, unlikely [Trypanosoma brucei gambiense DAL972]CBH16660.1 hypothetical protein, unlikely [Trypanosoma brucei gambiense DAL972]|eukprot:XP_011778924.1 hypothetical protein, unlikely [Trypanosoma brucei gambiense DAL972]